MIKENWKATQINKEGEREALAKAKIELHLMNLHSYVALRTFVA